MNIIDPDNPIPKYLQISGWSIVARTVIIYLALLFGLRVAGKREMGQMTPFDLVVIILVANAVQNAMVGPDNSVTGGLIAAAVLIGGNYAVGLVVFFILVVINFVVITKGAGRIAEVSARFTLDAMPGKQMAIDADLNAGLIGEEDARRRRREVSQEAEFYGAMDGASKFVRGDAVAGIIILPLLAIGPDYLPRLFPESWRPEVANIVNFAYYPVLAMGLLFMLTVLYKVAPKHKHPWYRGVPGALLAAAVFIVASFGLRLYLSYVYSHGLTYGALATPITFLLFYYFVSMAIIIGAQFNNAMLEFYPPRPSKREQRKWRRYDPAKDEPAGG